MKSMALLFGILLASLVVVALLVLLYLYITIRSDKFYID